MNSVHFNLSPHFIPAFHEGLQTFENKIANLSKQIFKGFDKFWSYAGKTILISRKLLTATLRSCRLMCQIGCDQGDKIKAVLARLKLFSIVSVPLGAVSIPEQIQKIWKGVQLRDAEGTALSTLSFALNVTDMFDSLTTVVNGVLETLSHPTLSWISAISMPISFALIGMGSVSRVVRIKNLWGFLREVDKDILVKMQNQQLTSDELRTVLNAFLNAKLGPREARGELKSQVLQYKKAVLDRSSTGKATAILNEIAERLTRSEALTDEEIKHIVRSLETAQNSIKHEMAIQGAYLFTNCVNAVALGLFFVPGVTILPLLMMSASLLLRIAIQSYQDFNA